MDLPTLRDANSEKLFKRAKDFYSAKDYINALEIIEDLRFVQGNDRVFVNVVQGQIFKELAEKTENTDVKVAYLLGSVQCLSIAPGLSSLAAISLFILAQQLDSVVYYKKSVRKAKEALYNLTVNLQDPEFTKREQKGMLSVIEIAESRIAESKTRGVVKKWEQKESGDTRKSEPDIIKGLMLYWVGLNVEIKRNFMKVSTAELTSYVEGLYGSEGLDALEQVLTFAREEGKWRFWMCRSCSNKFSSAEECKNHLEQQHRAKFLPNSTKHMPQRISKVWSRKISIGSWQPVDAAAAIELIKNRLEDVKAFAYENGWSKDWPLAVDEERTCHLQDMQSRPGEDSLSKHPGSAYEETTTKYNSILDMVLKALFNLKVLKEDLDHNRQPFSDNQVPCALRDFFSAFVAEQIEYEGLYSYLLSGLLASLKEVHPMSNDAAEVVIAILEFWQCWKSPQRESLVTRLFTLEVYERMQCSKCRKMPNYPEQRSYGIVMTADSIRDLNCAFGNIKFGDIIKVIRMEDKMLCDIKTRGCGKIGCGEEGEHICMAYKKNRWVSLRHEALTEEVVGICKNVVRFCGERRVRPEILFYEAARLDR